MPEAQVLLRPGRRLRAGRETRLGLTLCAFCDAQRDTIIGVTEAGLHMCQHCYDKALIKEVTREPVTTKADISKGLRAKVPRLETTDQGGN
ncbi:MAG TPA: hypothetical protein VGR56_07185 [Nitrososphaerales archaeon]|nr:hypothetical protein [Nitrososphaerales archaeon]